MRAVAHSLSGMLVESLDGDGLSTNNRLSCLNALKMTVYLLCQMCEQYELSLAKPVTLTVPTKVHCKCSNRYSVLLMGNYVNMNTDWI